MKVEDKIELQSVAKESCSSYLFMDGKLFSIFKSYTNKTLDVNTLSSYEPIIMPVKHFNLLFFFFLISLIHTKIKICFITCEQFLGESMK